MGIVEMEIDSVRPALLKNGNWAIILKEKAGQRYLPIWVGKWEADSIGLRLLDVNVSRPLPHDLLQSVIDVFGANVNSVIINDLKEVTFYAKLVLTLGEKKFEVDCRPSDALALAVRAQAPIFADERVVNEAGIPFGAPH